MNLENVVLGYLIITPEFLNSDGLSVDLFMGQKNKLVFKTIKALHEKGLKPDLVSLAGELEGKIDAAFIASFMDGVPKGSPENFTHYIVELKKTQLTKKVMASLEKQTRSGGDYDLAEAKKFLEEIAEITEGRERRSLLDLAHFTGIGMQPVEWLWYPVAPFGMVGTVLGNPGVGKSFLLTDLAARISSGRALPVYRKPTGQIYKGWVIYITSEGVPDKILKPRLYAAGADMENVTLVRGTYNEEKEFQVLDIRHHLPLLLELIRTERETGKRICVLVIIDPIASFVSGKTNLNDSVQARHALDVIARFAEEASVSVLVAIHPNKDETKKLMSRASGSVQISAAVKSAWIVADPQDDDPENMRYFAPYKITLVPFNKNETLPFYLDEANFEHDGKFFEMARLRWSEKTVKCDVEKIISPRVDEGLPQPAKVRTWLKEQLQGGSRLARELYAAAEDRGFSKQQLWRAKDVLGVQDMPDGFQGPIIWYLPVEEEHKE